MKKQEIALLERRAALREKIVAALKGTRHTIVVTNTEITADEYATEVKCQASGLVWKFRSWSTAGLLAQVAAHAEILISADGSDRG